MYTYCPFGASPFKLMHFQIFFVEFTVAKLLKAVLQTYENYIENSNIQGNI